ncbi:uncharacterized protein PITG_16123 [Phytophthora infestans T30-4]|uniref:DDE Tnp4 domain-containing protein n=1 Tax=Phytophthora infestans (strain T30-4) TaxID=403677 RepID=D0NSY2_PHYIT|nr:uncharacterized protein PITG_16123 [Phytophthora infestans T30-4]EEY64694.1 conserved hypothetical protein [Phytophthora infestans T30-4]|eukprot:XP_002897894.1 conserved hypothetical protein [Phytophthora infestans T30-4]
MPDSEFKLRFRLSRPYFRAVLSLISDHAEFKSIPGKQPKMCVELHLLGLFKILGSTDGEGRSVDFLSVGGLTAESLLAKRCIRALNSLVSNITTTYWFIYGTLFPLLTRPQDHGEDYFSRKASYAINGLVICDDQSRIRYGNVGWPGSSHDNRTSNVLVPAFKTSAGGQLSVKKIHFSKCLAQVRIQIKATIELIRPCKILHNMAIADPVPDDWIEPEPGVDFDGDDEDKYLAPSGEIAEDRRDVLSGLAFDIAF